MVPEQAVHKEILLAAPLGEVWAALTNGDRLAAWFGAEARLELRPGGRATFCWPDGTTRIAAVEVVEVERLLILRWFPFADDAHGGRRWQPATKLCFLLQATPHGTRLWVTESAPPAQGALPEDCAPVLEAGADPSRNSRDPQALAAL